MDSKKEENRYIGVDFSLNNPSICIMEHGKISRIISITRDEHEKEWFLKKKKNPYIYLEECKGVKLYFLDKPKIPKDYIKRERVKLDHFEELTDFVLASIGDYIRDFGPDLKTQIAIEGIAFMAAGNSLIDISMATHSLRSKIVNKILLGNSDQFFVFSPATIKGTTGYLETRKELKETNPKYDIKGQAKKWEMYKSLINSDSDYLRNSAYVDLLRENEEEWILPSQTVKKPLDDLNDAIWTALTLEGHLNS